MPIIWCSTLANTIQLVELFKLCVVVEVIVARTKESRRQRARPITQQLDGVFVQEFQGKKSLQQSNFFRKRPIFLFHFGPRPISIDDDSERPIVLRRRPLKSSENIMIHIIFFFFGIRKRIGTRKNTFRARRFYDAWFIHGSRSFIPLY